MDTKPVTMELYKRGQEAVEKFDYFVCGVTGAVFSYEIHNYSPEKLRFDFSLFEPLSLLLLAVAFIFGLKRLSTASLAANLNHRLIDVQDKAEQCARILEHPERGRDLAGNPIDVPAMKKLHQGFLDEWQKLNEPLSLADKKAKMYYKCRDRFLIAGFAAIF